MLCSVQFGSGKIFIIRDRAGTGIWVWVGELDFNFIQINCSYGSQKPQAKIQAPIALPSVLWQIADKIELQEEIFPRQGDQDLTQNA